MTDRSVIPAEHIERSDLDSEALDFRAASESFAPGRRLKRAALAGWEGRLTSEIASVIGLTPRATRTRLVDRGREIGTGPQDPKRRYFRAA